MQMCEGSVGISKLDQINMKRVSPRLYNLGHNIISSTDRDIQSSTKESGAVKSTVLPVLAASFCTAAAMYPLDFIRAQQMAFPEQWKDTGAADLVRGVLATHGYKGLLTQGLAPELGRATLSRFIKFALYPAVHKIISGRPASEGSLLTRAAAGGLTTVPELLAVLPLELLKVALQLDTEGKYENSMVRAFQHLYSTHGPRLLTVGYLAMQYKQASWALVYFASLVLYERLVIWAMLSIWSAARWVIGRREAELYGEAYGWTDQDQELSSGGRASARAVAGFFAGATGALANTPGDVVRTMIQKRFLSTGGSVPEWVGLGQVDIHMKVLRGLIEEGGWQALYNGLVWKALHMGGVGALMALLVPLFFSPDESIPSTSCVLAVLSYVENSLF